MAWVGTFQQGVSEAFRALDSYFNGETFAGGGPSVPLRAPMNTSFDPANTSQRVTFYAPDYLGSITFLGTGLEVSAQPTATGVSFPRLTGGTINTIVMRFNPVLDEATTLRAFGTPQQKEVAQNQIDRSSNISTLLGIDLSGVTGEINFFPGTAEVATINVGAISAAELGTAVTQSYQARSAVPLQTYMAQFNHIYTATQNGHDLVGHNGADVLIGAVGNHNIVGQAGDDTINVSTAGGINIMDGGQGSDLYLLGPGVDRITDNGTQGVDFISYARAPAGVGIDLNPLDGVDRSFGNARGDAYGGIEGVIGSAFDDFIEGKSFVFGAPSTDILNGGRGNDTINAGEGHDTLIGGQGFDGLVGGGNTDVVGNPGPADVAAYEAAGNTVHFFRLVNGTLQGAVNNGGDFLSLFPGAQNALVIATPDEGVDMLFEIEVLRLAGQDFSANPNSLTFSNANLQIGTDQSERLSASDGVDLLYGRRGNDVLNGLGGVDTVAGGEGNDLIRGGAGGDWLTGGFGNDGLWGGAGIPVALTGPVSGQIFRLYRATLDRDPDVGGHAGWTEQVVTGGRTLLQVTSGFTNSAEFTNLYGELNNDGFVELLYQNVLGRPSDAVGKAGWLAQMQNGATRAEVVLGFSESLEFINGTRAEARAFAEAGTPQVWQDDVFRLYLATLGRDPDLPGFLGWSGNLGSGTPYLTAVAGFVASTEFQNTYGTLSNGGFVDLLYQNVLGRPADATGKQGWLTQMANGTTREEVVAGFAQSGEFIRGTAEALRAWVTSQGTDDLLDGGAGQNVLAGGMLSDVFVFDRQDGGTNRVLGLEAWDFVSFENFNYASDAAARAHLTQVGPDVVFADQGVEATFAGATLAMFTDEMILV